MGLARLGAGDVCRWRTRYGEAADYSKDRLWSALGDAEKNATSMGFFAENRGQKTKKKDKKVSVAGKSNVRGGNGLPGARGLAKVYR